MSSKKQANAQIVNKVWIFAHFRKIVDKRLGQKLFHPKIYKIIIFLILTNFSANECIKPHVFMKSIFLRIPKIANSVVL